MKDATLIIGASDNPARYSYIAAERLLEHNHKIELLGLRAREIFNHKIEIEQKAYKNIDTVTMYVGAARQTNLYDYIISLAPRRVIFNPGTENDEFVDMLRKKGIETIEACTLVMLSLGQY